MTVEQANFLAEARWIMHVREEMDAEQLQESRWIYQGTKRYFVRGVDESEVSQDERIDEGYLVRSSF
jgi:hypothetical protein